MVTDLFQPFDFYMLRTPLLPFERYQQLFSGQDVETVWFELANDPVIREMLAVCSLSLYHSLTYLTQDANPRKRDQVRRGLLRYLIRSATRPTPYGLCAGVTSGEWSEQTVMTLYGKEQHRKRTRPDMEWLLKVVQALEERPEVVEQLQVQANPLIYAHGSRLKLPFVTRYGQFASQKEGGHVEVSSIRSSEVVEFALAEARDRMPFHELQRRIRERYREVPTETIRGFLWQLFQQEYLISELRPPMMDGNPFDHLLNCLSTVRGADDIKDRLQDIKADLLHYDRFPIGQGEVAFCELAKKMKRVADVPNPLQVDFVLGKEQVSLHAAIGDEVAKAAEVLWKIAPDASCVQQHLEAYRREFVEKYGTDREVPLLELLDEDQGLGAPATYQYPPSHRKLPVETSAHEQKRQALLMQWVVEALQKGDQEVVLTEERVELLAVDKQESAAPLSHELYFTIAARTKEAVDQGNYLLFPGGNPGSPGAGKTFGRFLDLLGTEFQEQMELVQQQEQAAIPDAVFAELVFLPNKGRFLNVALSVHTRPYEIVFGTNPSKEPKEVLPLSDLVVGSTFDTFYLKSKSLNKEVIPTTSHMLTMPTVPNLYQFLYEVGLARRRIWLPFTWGMLEQAPVLPRLRYGRTVLFAARWLLNRSVLPVAPDVTAEEFYRAVQMWREQWKVPRYVQVQQRDNRLLLDLENALLVEELQRDVVKLRKLESLELVEIGANLSEQWVEGVDGHYRMECVFPLKRKPFIDLVTQETVACKGPVITPEERLYLPGSEWLFVKWYGVKQREEEFIGGPMREFCLQVEHQGLADHSFFMRYADPNPHVRLRFQGEPTRLMAELQPKLHRFAQQMQREGLLSQLVFDTYDPEIERYGGPNLIRWAERWFAADSRTVAEWVGLVRQGQMGFSLKQIGVLSTIDLLERFRLTAEEQILWLERRVPFKEHLDEFRMQRKVYLQWVDRDNATGGLLQHPDGKRLSLLFELRSQPLLDYVQAMQEKAANGDLYSTPERILESVLHLHLNRLLGLDRNAEQNVMSLARHVLYGREQARAVKR